MSKISDERSSAMWFYTQLITYGGRSFKAGVEYSGALSLVEKSCCDSGMVAGTLWEIIYISLKIAILREIVSASEISKYMKMLRYCRVTCNIFFLVCINSCNNIERCNTELPEPSAEMKENVKKFYIEKLNILLIWIWILFPFLQIRFKILLCLERNRKGEGVFQSMKN